MIKRENSQGKRFFGLHFYPGVAEYKEPNQKSYRVYLNATTLREMDKSFEGKPVYVMHKDDVPEQLDELRKEADGWVLRSFYNAADGKHWVEFLVVSERGLRAVNSGMRLSNSYYSLRTEQGGLWNGVEYAKEITEGEYEHLAIVPNPRYDESKILTPEEFRAYNEAQTIHLLKVNNNKDKGEDMKVKLFKREKVENNMDDLLVQLPTSKREISVVQMVEELDQVEQAKNKPRVVNSSDLVKVGEEELSVEELVEELTLLRNAAKCENEEEDEDEKKPKKNKDEDKDDIDNEDEDDMDNEDEDDMDNEDEDEDEKKPKKNKNKKSNSDDDDFDEKKALRFERRKAARERADRLSNAHKRGAQLEEASVDFSGDMVERGKQRYGSGK